MALEKGVRGGLDGGTRIGTVETERKGLERRQSPAKSAYRKGEEIRARYYRNARCDAQSKKSK